MELQDIFNGITEKLAGFPEVDLRFLGMSEYINEIAEFLEFIYVQKIIRLKAEIPTIEDPVAQGEAQGKLQQLEDDGLEYLSHAIWGGVLVSIFATYESSMQELFVFLGAKLGKPEFKRMPRLSFIESANSYSKEHFNIGIFRDRTDRLLLNDLSKLRNSYVHNGCSLDLLSNPLRDAIVSKKYKMYSLGVKDGKWLANSHNTRLYFQYVYDSFEYYQRRAAQVLFGPA